VCSFRYTHEFIRWTSGASTCPCNGVRGPGLATHIASIVIVVASCVCRHTLSPFLLYLQDRVEPSRFRFRMMEDEAERTKVTTVDDWKGYLCRIVSARRGARHVDTSTSTTSKPFTSYYTILTINLRMHVHHLTFGISSPNESSSPVLHWASWRRSWNSPHSRRQSVGEGINIFYTVLLGPQYNLKLIICKS
jgi:hypothetical protein